MRVVIISRGNRRQGTTRQRHAFEFKQHACQEILAVKLRSCTREVCAQDRPQIAGQAQAPHFHPQCTACSLPIRSAVLVVVSAAAVLGGRVSLSSFSFKIISRFDRLNRQTKVPLHVSAIWIFEFEGNTVIIEALA